MEQGWRIVLLMLAGISVISCLSCPTGWMNDTEGICFTTLLLTGEETVVEAQRQCQLLGGVLASIETQAQNDLAAWYANYLKGIDSWTTGVFFGLSDMVTEGDFQWMDGVTALTFTSWHPGSILVAPQPDNVGWYQSDGAGCVIADSNGRWMDVSCCQGIYRKVGVMCRQVTAAYDPSAVVDSVTRQLCGQDVTTVGETTAGEVPTTPPQTTAAVKLTTSPQTTAEVKVTTSPQTTAEVKVTTSPQTTAEMKVTTSPSNGITTLSPQTTPVKEVTTPQIELTTVIEPTSPQTTMEMDERTTEITLTTETIPETPEITTTVRHFASSPQTTPEDELTTSTEKAQMTTEEELITTIVQSQTTPGVPFASTIHISSRLDTSDVAMGTGTFVETTIAISATQDTNNLATDSIHSEINSKKPEVISTKNHLLTRDVSPTTRNGVTVPMTSLGIRTHGPVSSEIDHTSVTQSRHTVRISAPTPTRGNVVLTEPRNRTYIQKALRVTVLQPYVRIRRIVFDPVEAPMAQLIGGVSLLAPILQFMLILALDLDALYREFRRLFRHVKRSPSAWRKLKCVMRATRR